jgi:hypothetical protein
MRHPIRFVAMMAVLALAIGVGCGKSEPPKKSEAAPAAAPAPAEAPKPAAVVTPPAGQPTAEAAKAAEAGEAGEAPAPRAAEAAPAVDKDKLAKAYLAVYCAQKKGEMDKILGIYKEFGFDTPQSFTKTWIEAAKDTDWVTKIAHDVGKKCP